MGGDKKIVQRNTIEKALGKEGKQAIKYLQISAKNFQHKRTSEKILAENHPPPPGTF
jgi:hypothetical protein